MHHRLRHLSNARGGVNNYYNLASKLVFNLGGEQKNELEKTFDNRVGGGRFCLRVSIAIAGRRFGRYRVRVSRLRLRGLWLSLFRRLWLRRLRRLRIRESLRILSLRISVSTCH